MKEKIKVGYVGLGRRGTLMLKECFLLMKDVEITTVCDLFEERLEKTKELFVSMGREEPKTTKNYDDILADKEIDAVILMSGWDQRVKMAKSAMLAGKYTAIEVGCSQTIEECYELIDVYEKTGVPLMMLENCCYGRREMMVLNMVKMGLFGEIVHCTGAYSHYLNDCELFVEICKEGKKDISHYRLKHYVEENKENYPTHELGPIAKVLNINRGNRFVSLSSFASKSVGIKDFVKRHIGEGHKYAQTDYSQGDIINTIITCAGGETVAIKLDTTVPRAYYCREFSVRGTKGMSTEERRAIYLEGMPEPTENNEEDFYLQYDHPLHKEYVAEGERGGHGGMDWLVSRAFVEAVKRGTNTPIDAYDSVTLLAIGALSEASIKGGGIPVEFPDFTRGKWKNREPVTPSKYCLDEICEDKETSIFCDL